MNKSNRTSLIRCLIAALTMTTTAASFGEHILPESTTPVVVSNRDVNRIVCAGGDINNVYFSQEKGLVVTNEGKNAFVKFKSIDEGGSLKRITQKTELYVTCAFNVYTLIMDPQNVDAQTHYLGNGDLQNVKDNQEVYGSMPDEQRALELTLSVLKNEIPESFTVARSSQVLRDYHTNVIPEAKIAKIQDVSMDGIGLSLQEYQVVADSALLLQETQFLDIYFGKNIFAISIEPRNLSKGDYARVFVVQKEGN